MRAGALVLAVTIPLPVATRRTAAQGAPGAARNVIETGDCIIDRDSAKAHLELKDFIPAQLTHF